eukprot:TRINITY_DN30782_c0_g1_i1.p1 TRINITY_DN30782_c0_g1~~TRINITY_DN30782_c0_g1_i1.p1  ORF type:complete len:223 (+),score=18.72 TRINITY_DN30782_c0_g1_i1:105-773(+)
MSSHPGSTSVIINMLRSFLMVLLAGLFRPSVGVYESDRITFLPGTVLRPGSEVFGVLGESNITTYAGIVIVAEGVVCLNNSFSVVLSNGTDSEVENGSFVQVGFNNSSHFIFNVTVPSIMATNYVLTNTGSCNVSLAWMLLCNTVCLSNPPLDPTPTPANPVPMPTPILIIKGPSQFVMLMLMIGGPIAGVVSIILSIKLFLIRRKEKANAKTYQTMEDSKL